MFLLKIYITASLPKNSELKAKFLFKNKNAVSLGGDVDWVRLVGNVVVRDCIGSNFVLVEIVVVG